MKKVLGTAAIAAAICATPAQAEDKEATLEAVTVTSTKTQKVISEAPASVSVVTDKQMENKNVGRIDDALKNLPGVYINAAGDGTPSNYNNQILLRGIPGYYRTAIMVDGQNVSNGFSQGFNASSVPMDSIQQIEVVPGPFSSLYGGSAMGGVVNIITKAPNKREVLLSSGYGSNQTYEEKATYRDKFKLTGEASLGLAFNVDYAASEGYVQDYVAKSASGGGGTNVWGWQATTDNKGTAAYIVGDKGKKGWTKDNASMKLFLEPDNVSKLTGDIAYHNSYTEFEHGNSYLRDAMGNAIPSGTASQNVTLNGSSNIAIRNSDFLAGPTGEEIKRAHLAYERNIWQDATFKANFGHMQNGYWYVTPSAGAMTNYGTGTYTDIPNDRTEADVQLGKTIATDHYLIVGFSGNLAQLDKKVYNLTNWTSESTKRDITQQANGETMTKALYVQDEYTFNNALTFYAGARLDRWATSGSYIDNAAPKNDRTYTERTKGSLSPKTSVVYKFDKETTFRAAWGKAFRTPSLSDMYSTYGTTTIYWANPDLKPEKSKSWEFGGEHTFTATGTTIKGTWFNTQIKDLIYSYTTGTNNYKVSAGGAHVNGVEGEVRQKVVDGITAFANITIQDSHITSNAIVPTSVGKRVTYMPDKMWNVGVEGRYADFFGSVNVNHTENTFTTNDSTDNAQGVYNHNDTYTLVSAKIGWDITENYAATLSVNNLLDEKYYLQQIMPGRTYFFTVKAHY
jgi:iron complex outermembrane receptor protein